MNFRTALLLVASLAASSDAFSTSSSFTRRMLPSAAPSAYRSSSSSSSSALSMNLFDRFSRVAKSNINNVLKSLEDPEKIMNQAVEDMQVSILFICKFILLYDTLQKTQHIQFTKFCLFCAHTCFIHNDTTILNLYSDILV